MKFKRVYDNSPIFLQNIMTSVYGRKLFNKRHGEVYRKHLIYLRENFYKMDHYEYQLISLNKFLEYIRENSKYYNEKISEEILPINKLSDLEKIEILNKETIRIKIDDIITEPKKDLSISFTGGTTGKSLNVFYNNEDTQKRMAFLDFFKERHNVKQGMRRASFTGKNIVPLRQKSKNYWRYNRSLNQLLFSSFHLNDENIPFYIKKLNNFKPQSLDGFPSVMYTLSKYIVEHNIKLSFKPIAIFPTAETLTDYEKSIIEKAFNSKVRNQYASSEGAPFITECPMGNLHMDIMTGVFEKKDKGNIVSEVLVTAFETRGTPLVRYEIGDSLEFSNRLCTCGYNTPLVERIIGRSTDYLYSEERGKISSANMSNTIKNLPNSIKNIQFIQIEIDEVLINLVIDESKFIERHEKEIINELKIRLGEHIKYKIQYVDFIPKEKSGKFRMVKNQVTDKINRKMEG